MAELVYDTGALIAAERGDARLLRIHAAQVASGQLPLVPTVVIAQAWRGGARQALLARFLRSCTELAVVTTADARTIGTLLGKAGARDVIDAFVVLIAVHHAAGIITSDPEDLETLAAALGVTLDIAVV